MSDLLTAADEAAALEHRRELNCTDRLPANVSAFSLECPPEGFVADPYPWYAALQERQPIHRLSDGSWLLTRHADCLAVYHGDAFSSDKQDFFRPKFGAAPLYEHHTTSLVFNDPPLSHTSSGNPGQCLETKEYSAHSGGARAVRTHAHHGS